MMTVENTIRPYDITNGEKVEYGYYSALEVVFRQYLEKLESYFYDEFKLTFDFSFSIKTDVKYKHYLASVHQPSAIFIFKHHPLMRDSILKADNRLINLFLFKQNLFNNGKVAIDNSFSIDRANSKLVKSSIEDLLQLFQESWTKIYPVQCQLKKLVTNRIKAKIMDDTEACVVVNVTMKQNQYCSNWEFCLSRYQLDRIVEKHGAQGLLAASCNIEQDSDVKRYLTKLLIESSEYSLKGVLGSVNLSSKEILESYKSGSVIPIANPIQNKAVVYLNQTPVLSADVGQTHDRLSLQIQESYQAAKEKNEQNKKQFSKIFFKNR